MKERKAMIKTNVIHLILSNIQAQPTLVNKSTYLKNNKEDVWFPKSIKERKKIKKL